jgi:ABC-type Fe3+/spermidine/putrescine transport system ATPase subunit
MAASLRLSELTKIYGTTRAVDRLSLSGDAYVVDEDVAGVRLDEAGDHPQCRRLAAAARPKQRHHVAGRDRVPVHRRNIGMLFQNYALFPHMTVAENIAFGLETRGVKGSAAAARVQGALQLVQLSGYSDRLPPKLSGGQQQRVALARALVVEPMLLLLDEPLGALDKSLRQSMQTELRGLQQRLGVTTVFVTHDQNEALTMADRIVIMRDGWVEQIGAPTKVYQRPVSRFVADFPTRYAVFSSEFRGKRRRTEHGRVEAAEQHQQRVRQRGQILARGFRCQRAVVEIRTGKVDPGGGDQRPKPTKNLAQLRIDCEIVMGGTAHRDDPHRLSLQRPDRHDVEKVLQHARKARPVDRYGDQHRRRSGDPADCLAGCRSVSVERPSVAGVDRRFGEVHDIDVDILGIAANRLRRCRDRRGEPAGRCSGPDHHQKPWNFSHH